MNTQLVMNRLAGLALALALGPNGVILASPPPALVDVRAAAGASPRSGLRLTFEANKGQAEKQTRYLARGDGYRLSLAREGATLELDGTDMGVGQGRGEAPSWVRLRLLDARARPGMRGLWESGERVLTLGGEKPRRNKVPTFEKVLYKGVYPGINLVFYGRPDRLEYDFIVDPRANPGAIRLALDGADRIELEESGDLLLHTETGTVRQKKPVAYQTLDGKRREVPVGYALEAGNQILFRLGAYDPARPLVIDPVLIVER